MNSRQQAQSPGLAGFALAGLGSGAAATLLLGPQPFAGFMAAALAVGALMAFRSLGLGGRVLPLAAAGVAMLFPPAVIEFGEGGMVLAVAFGLVVLAGSTVAGGLRAGALATLAVGSAVVVHLGLLGSYLVLIAVREDRLLFLLVLMLGAFELVYLFLARRFSPSRSGPGGRFGARDGRRQTLALIDVRAAAGGVVGCQGVALFGRLLMPEPLGLVSLLILGAAVGGGASLGHAGAALFKEDSGEGPEATVFAFLNAALFATGTFYYGFRLYLA